MREKTGPARLLDMIEGRSKAVFKTWLAERPKDWRDGLEVVAMDGFTGFKTAAAEEIPEAVPVLDPFHGVRLAGDALDECRRRVQRRTCGHRGRRGDPLFNARRTLHTGVDLLTDKQQTRLDAPFADDAHVEVEATWGIYQQMVTAYRDPDRATGRKTMTALIDSLRAGVPKTLTAIVKLGRTLNRRAADVLAYFDRPGTSNGPTEAINGRLGTPARIRTRLPQPHQLHRPSTTGNRRIQTTTTPRIVKSPYPLMPALLTSTPMSPSASLCATRATSSPCDKSATTVSTCTPHSARNRAASSSSRSPRRATSTKS